MTGIDFIEVSDPDIPGLWAGWAPVAVGWDVGANIGQSIPQLAAFCDQIVSFEPAVESYEVLVHRVVARGWRKVLCSPLALSDVSGRHCLLADPVKLRTGQLGDEASWEGLRGPAREVDFATADELVAMGWDPPGFLKIDVEGHEGRVLTGATQLLTSRCPQVLLEAHSASLGAGAVDLFHRLGYQHVTEVRHPGYSPGSSDWANHFYVKARP